MFTEMAAVGGKATPGTSHVIFSRHCGSLNSLGHFLITHRFAEIALLPTVSFPFSPFWGLGCGELQALRIGGAPCSAFEKGWERCGEVKYCV